MNEKYSKLEFEKHIGFLLSRDQSLNVVEEPSIGGKTPDFLVSDNQSCCIVECTSLSIGDKCEQDDHEIGDVNPNQLQTRLWETIVRKIDRYSPNIIGNVPLVIVVKNDDCSHRDLAIIDVLSGASRFVDGNEKMMWEGEYLNGIFGNPRHDHCSGVIHAVGSHDYLFVRNPNANNPVNEGFFEFAHIAKSNRYNRDYQIDASSPIYRCPDALLTLVRETHSIIKTPWGDQTMTEPTGAPEVEVVGYTDDGHKQISIKMGGKDLHSRFNKDNWG